MTLKELLLKYEFDTIVPDLLPIISSRMPACPVSISGLRPATIFP